MTRTRLVTPLLGLSVVLLSATRVLAQAPAPTTAPATKTAVTTMKKDKNTPAIAGATRMSRTTCTSRAVQGSSLPAEANSPTTRFALESS